MSENEFSFPTLGEATRTLFDCTGLLARKSSPSSILADETQKKTIQTKLRRLAKEEGDLDKVFSELCTYLLGLVCEVTEDIRVTYAFMDTVHDLYDSFRHTLSGEATYLSKRETIKWLLENQFADLVIKSVNKYSLKYGLVVSELESPAEPAWWLPSITSGKIDWPLERAWRWIYQVADTSQSRFHNPSNDEGRPRQNSENASRWFNRNRLPQWGELVQNLDTSLKELAVCTDSKYQRRFDASRVNCFKINLFFARMSTDIFMRIHESFGTEYTKELVRQMSAQNRRMAKLQTQMKADIQVELMFVGPLPGLKFYEFWSSAVEQYWMIYAEFVAEQSYELQNLLQQREGAPFSFGEFKQLRCKFDPIFLAMVMRQQKSLPGRENIVFMQLYLDGCKLRKRANLDDIEQYRQEIIAKRQEETLMWLVEWMYATYYYRRDEHDSALQHYRNSFDLAKHSVGGDTYLLVNQYAESCAKNDNWREFKKVVAWACHRGVKIRWHRGCEASEDAAQYAFQCFKFGKYPIV